MTRSTTQSSGLLPAVDTDTTASADEMYAHRLMRDGYPGLGQMAHEVFTTAKGEADEQLDDSRVAQLIERLQRLTDLPAGARILVIGCGPVPRPIAFLRAIGYDAVGVEPEPSFVRSAQEYIGVPGIIMQGAAESIPVQDESYDAVMSESVLEHVDSVGRSLEEMYRVLKPGGFAYVITTNRYALSLRGHDGEFAVRFFGWLPSLVKECYVFVHHHYRPSLARYTERPAVHWFSFAHLCRVGREAGFHQFYSPLDLRRPGDSLPPNPLIRFAAGRFLGAIQRSPWLRALALTQVGATVIMLKRANAAGS